MNNCRNFAEAWDNNLSTSLLRKLNYLIVHILRTSMILPVGRHYESVDRILQYITMYWKVAVFTGDTYLLRYEM